jgi:type IV secretion system protein VirB10
MTDPLPIPPKEDPETLVLRGKPDPVVRFKRPVLVGAVGLGCAAIFAVTWLGLGPATPKASEKPEPVNADAAANQAKPLPEKVQNLPESYAQVSSGVPQLGEPLPGDLGGPILAHQRGTATMAASAGPERVSTTQASVPGVFFQVSNHEGTATIAKAIEPVAMPASLTLQAAPATAKGQGTSIYNSHGLQTPISPYQVMAGTVINASLITGLKSDLPGTIIAQVTAPIYDTVTGKILLIPAGSRLLGGYESALEFGQSRVLLVWKRLIMPDGTSLEIDNFPATDTEGYSGLTDKVDYHTWSLLKGVGLSTLLGLTAYDGADDDSDLVQAFRESLRQTANQAGQQLVAKAIGIKPSVTVRPGWPVRVIVQKDLVLQPYDEGAVSWPN